LPRQARSRGCGTCPASEHGAGLTNLQYAPLAEVTGRSLPPGAGRAELRAPDTGNMEVLATFGSPEQQKRWLTPLARREIRSSFAMTEPEVASSDRPTSPRASSATGDEYVINATVVITGAMNPKRRSSS